jgi:RHS repeat-associated protein
MNFFQKTSSLLLILLFLFSPLAPLFANDQLIAIIKGTGATAQVYQISTDHLTGSNVVINSTGALEELMDYYSYGGIRLDEKAGSFSEQRKYAGHELDVDTGLSYMNARYYSGKIGRFVSQDSVSLAMGDNAKIKELTKQELTQLLSDPQVLNSYAYARNNPLVYRDSDGNFIQFAVAAVFMAFATYAPQITSFLQSLTTSIGQIGLIQANQDAQKGNYGIAMFGAITAGEVPAGKIMSAAGKTGSTISNKIINLVNRIDRHGSYEKHVLGQREYGTLFENKEQWKDYVNSVITNPSASFKGLTKDLYWDSRLGTIVIDNKMGGAPTAFRPELSIERGKAYYLKEVNEQLKRVEGGAR